MARAILLGSGSGGLDTDELTATTGDVLAGKKFGGVGSDEVQTGTLTLTGNADDAKVLIDYTYYNTDAKTKRKGSLNVQSILSFSSSTYSSREVMFTWTNPQKGAFSGVIIVGKTGSYPTSIVDGTRYYKGYGNNTGASGSSQVLIGGFTSGNRYYFRAFSYALKNGAEWVHPNSYTDYADPTKGQVVFTSSQIWTVPAGVRSIDVFLVGGGSGGKHAQTNNPGGGGGGGYTNTWKSYPVEPNQQYPVSIGNGSSQGVGGSTHFGDLSVQGGQFIGLFKGMNGGSGGGGTRSHTAYALGGDGGSDGSDGLLGGGLNGDVHSAGNGQGRTTRAFGEGSNTLYSGGGGGGGSNSYGYLGGIGGEGGGGSGAGHYRKMDTEYYVYSIAGAPNTGGGGGGGGRWKNNVTNNFGASGGSGICIIRYGY